MKRYLREFNWPLLLAIILLWVVVASPVLGTTFISYLSVTNNSSTAYTYQPVIYSINNTYLTTNGYCSNTTMLDVNIKSADGTALKWMPVTDKTLFVAPSLLADSITTFIWSSGNSTLDTQHEIITGTGGNITTLDDAALELGDDFELEMSGSFKPTTSLDISAKTDAFQVSTGSGNVTVLLPDGTNVTGTTTEGSHTIKVVGKAASGWLTGYDYRKEITLYGSSAGNQTNYQLPLTVVQDGFTWERIGTIGSYNGTNPVIAENPAGWDAMIREPGNILYEPTDTGREYKILYSGYETDGNNPGIGYAYSSDGDTWTKYASNPVISGAYQDPYVVKSGSTYYMFVERNSDSQIVRYQSTDCITWSNETLVISKGTAGSWEAALVGSPVVWIEGSTWYMLYEGYVAGGYPAHMGLATSANGLTWTKSASNPVFTSGGGLDWDSQQVVPDDIIKDGSTYYLEYHGSDGTDWLGGGIAKSTNLTSWTRCNNGERTIFAGEAGNADTDTRVTTAMVFPIAPYNKWLYTSDSFPGSAGYTGGLWLGYAKNVVELGGHSQDDFDDVRFTTSDGTSLIDFWLEKKTDGTYADLWVEFDSVPASPATSTFYIYYGNASATSASSGASTFIQFDDFERGNNGDAVAGNWTVAAGSATISTDRAFGGTRSEKLSASTWTTIPQTAGTNYSIMVQAYKEGATGLYYPFSHGNGVNRMMPVVNDTEALGVWDTGSFVSLGVDTLADTWLQYAVYNINHPGDSYDWAIGGYVVDTGIGMETAASYNNVVSIANADVTAGDDIYIDNYIVRKWADPEPTWQEWGEEESGILLYIDDILIDFAPWVASGIDDTANDIIWTPYSYFDYIKLTIDGTEVLWYQPVDIITLSGADGILPDRAGTAQNGTIAFGSNAAGISVDVGPFGGGVYGGTEAKAPAYSLGSTGNFITNPPTPTGNFTTSLNPGWWGWDIWKDVATSSSTPVQLPLMLITGFIIIVISLTSSWIMRRFSGGYPSHFIKTAIIFGCMCILMGLQVYDPWMVICFAILAVALSWMSQQRGVN